MSNSGPPQAVRRFLRRPLVWAMVGAGFGVFLFGLDLHAARTEERDLRDALRLTGTVEGSYRRGTTVPVRYFNPVTEQEVLVDVYLWREDLQPDRPGETVPLRVSPDDPDVVTVAGDRFPLFHNVVGYLPFVLVPVAVAVTRRLGISRSRRLAASPGATFAMLGSVSPRGRFSRRQDLQLYPLDAPPGAPPACAVPLVSARCLPAKVTVFPVEVKGEPRPFGRVVVRVGDEVLWPAGRALVTRRVPRPAQFTDVAALRARPAPEPSAAESPDFWPVAGLA
ncbi:MAG: hypothetical protein M3P34_11045, partial [Actinomycetota bacterium]|nr:hypothetical protein [Actinomycetota bacterium]